MYILLIAAVVYLSFSVFKPSDSGGRIDYKSAIKLDIPPDYKNISDELQGEHVHVKDVALLFQKHLQDNRAAKLGVKYYVEKQQLIYLLNSEDKTIRQREINVSGTLMEYTWRGATAQRLRFAVEHNSFNPPGTSDAEVKNLYH